MTIHKTVLLEEAVEMLELKEGSVVVDATLGAGGHSQRILEKIGEHGKLIAFDQDEEAIKNFQEKVGNDKRIILIKSNFENIKERLNENGIVSVDAILADRGAFSSTRRCIM